MSMHICIWQQRDKSRSIILSTLPFIFYSICEIKTICNLSDNLGVPPMFSLRETSKMAFRVPEQSVSEQPVSEQPVSEQPVSEQPVSEQPVSEQPGLFHCAPTIAYKIK